MSETHIFTTKLHTIEITLSPQTRVAHVIVTRIADAVITDDFTYEDRTDNDCFSGMACAILGYLTPRYADDSNIPSVEDIRSQFNCLRNV